MSLNKKFFIGGAAAIEPTEYFSVKLYDGNGSSQSIDVGFAADFAYIKNRTVGQGWSVWDTVRGASSGYLETQNTNAELNPQNMLTFDSDGFDVSTNGGGYTQTNRSSSSDKYVAYSFKAGGTAVSNTDGSITSSVSASPESGFSIVKYTSTGTNGSTVGTGLNSPAHLVIIKSTTNATNWIVYNSALGTGKYLYLNSSNGAASSSWFGTSNTTFTLNNTFSDANTNGRQYIAYCIHSVEGFSKVSTYSGGSTNTIVTGFEPKFLMVKRTDSSGNWHIVDSFRKGSNNIIDDYLRANLSDAEQADIGQAKWQVYFTTNGFYFGDTTSTSLNVSGGTYLYLAIA